MYQSVSLYDEPRKTILPKLDLPVGEPEMSEFESAFLCGMLRSVHPKKILEVGVAGGGYNRHHHAVHGALGCAV